MDEAQPNEQRLDLGDRPADEVRLEKSAVRGARAVNRRPGHPKPPLETAPHHGTLSETGLDTDPLH